MAQLTIRRLKNMAQLTCSDGTIIQINNETERELREAFGPKPTFKVGDIFYRSRPSWNIHYVKIIRDGNRVGLHALLNPNSGETVGGYFDVHNINAITLAEVKGMTRFPHGLRHVFAENLVMSEK